MVDVVFSNVQSYTDIGVMGQSFPTSCLLIVPVVGWVPNPEQLGYLPQSNLVLAIWVFSQYFDDIGVIGS